MSADLDVLKTAQLARVHLTAEEAVKFQEQLAQVLDHVAKLSQVDVTGVEPTAHATAVYNVLRKDEARPGLPREEVLANAPRAANGLFIVPKVIE